ncbi:unnamed protein product [marine sediment metagenome]|uniref:Uncharacterized protein n=1 Tax=marine sediment metagenome TaxID=412755 RepID=X0Z4D7_9ZZZZ
MTEELNKKLAEWAGFSSEIFQGRRIWFAPDVEHLPALQYYEDYRYSPDFPSSLDACFEWLVPKTVAKLADECETSLELAYDMLFEFWLEKGVDALSLNVGEAYLLQPLSPYLGNLQQYP